MAEAINFHDPGANISGYCTSAVTGKRFVKISGNRQTGITKNVSINHATAAGRIFGVAATDGAVGATIDVERRPGAVACVEAGGTIAAFGEVEVGANGVAVALAAGVAVGYVLTGVTSGNDAEVHLY